ncbi:MAG: UxaA family hydrolase [Desulfovibrio sp.]|nr:UxaA family hydrolase [Desulfovibrio sp.]
MKHILVKNAKDSVGNALQSIETGESFCWEHAGSTVTLKACTPVPFAFKVALKDIKQGENVFCYGEPIGVATSPIRCGECVHIHNLQGKRGNS